MGEITIDKDVPMRRDKKLTGSKYPFSKMDVGDSSVEGFRENFFAARTDRGLCESGANLAR